MSKREPDDEIETTAELVAITPRIHELLVSLFKEIEIHAGKTSPVSVELTINYTREPPVTCRTRRKAPLTSLNIHAVKPR